MNKNERLQYLKTRYQTQQSQALQDKTLETIEFVSELTESEVQFFAKGLKSE